MKGIFRKCFISRIFFLPLEPKRLFPQNHCERCFESHVSSQGTSSLEGETDFTGLSRVSAPVEERARGHRRRLRKPVHTQPGRWLSSAAFLSATFIHDLSRGGVAVLDEDAAHVRKLPQAPKAEIRRNKSQEMKIKKSRYASRYRVSKLLLGFSPRQRSEVASRRHGFTEVLGRSDPFPSARSQEVPIVGKYIFSVFYHRTISTYFSTFPKVTPLPLWSAPISRRSLLLLGETGSQRPSLSVLHHVSKGIKCCSLSAGVKQTVK